MIRQTCAALVLVMGSSLTAHSQCFLLEEGESGLAIQAGVVGAKETTGFEFDLGYAFGRKVEIGMGIGHFNLSSGSGSDWSKSKATSGGQYLDFYPIIGGNGSFAVALGLHQSYSFAFRHSSNKTLTVGASLNVVKLNSKRAGVVLTVGYFDSQMINTDINQGHGLLGLKLVERDPSNNPVVFFVQVVTKRGSDVYGGGVSYTISLK